MSSQLSFALPPDWVDYPIRQLLGPGRYFRYDIDWAFYVGVYWIDQNGVEETHRTAISRAMLQRSARAPKEIEALWAQRKAEK